MHLLKNGRAHAELGRETLELETAAAASAGYPRIERRRRLSPAALAVANQKVGPAFSPVVIAGVVRAVDFVLLSAIGVGLYFRYAADLGGFSWEFLALVLGMAATAVMCLQTAGVYEIEALREPLRRVSRTVVSWAFVVALVAGAFLLFRRGDGIWPAWLAAYLVAGLAALAAARVIVRSILRDWALQGRLDHRTVVVGADSNGAQLIDALKAQRRSGIKVLGVFDDRNDARIMDVCAGVPKLGRVNDIIEFARRTRVDLVLFALPVSAETRILQMLKKLWVLPVDIRLSAHNNKLRFLSRAYSYVGEVPTFDVFKAPITDWDLVLKWVFDHVVGFLLLLLALPVMGAVAIAIKLDSSGPVLFRQKRFGFNNERIDVLKFRSMHHDQADPTAAKVVTRNDPRVTRVGRFIRKTSLDELPQLFNVVFRSNLSLVGPRPHAVQGKLQNRLFEEAVDGYFARHRIKPGITGWAQINGWRGEVDTDEKIQKRVEFDLYYIENWSLLFDLYILLKTLPALMTKSENAY